MMCALHEDDRVARTIRGSGLSRIIAGSLRALQVAGLFALAGCIGVTGSTMSADRSTRSEPGAGANTRETVRLSPAQECAVGFDLARQIYETVAVDGTSIRLSRTAGGCSRHAAGYLRRAGFAVTENATGKGQFAIATYLADDPDGTGQGAFIAVARLPGLVVTRLYRPGDGGVYAVSPVSVRSAGVSQ